eukprot:3153_1
MNCNLFLDGNDQSVLSKYDATKIANQQLISKIHRYYQHSFDAGYRLRFSEIQWIQNIEEKHENSHHLSKRFLNNSLTKINKELSRNTCQRTTRFHAFNTNNVVMEKKEDIISHDHDLQPKAAMYSFGFIFDYPNHSAYCTMKASMHRQYPQNWNYHYIGTVHYKYNDFKEELINNEICVISVKQLNVEFKKAEKHYNTDYCKTEIRGKCVEHVINAHYQRMTVREYSATTSQHVALSFTCDNNGIILNFGVHQIDNSVNLSRYFPCSWLSDYGNEQEYLFIQNEHGYFNFINIIHVPSGTEFYLIIKAFRIFLTLLKFGRYHKWYQLLLKTCDWNDLRQYELRKLSDTFGMQSRQDKKH